MTGDISPGAIARIHDVIRPYIRHTPTLDQHVAVILCGGNAQRHA
jgi:hypothetical protein